MYLYIVIFIFIFFIYTHKYTYIYNDNHNCNNDYSNDNISPTSNYELSARLDGLLDVFDTLFKQMKSEIASN